jgi:transposase
VFVRIKRNPRTSRCSVLACHSVRTKDKVKQVVIRRFGTAHAGCALDQLVKEAQDWVKDNKVKLEVSFVNKNKKAMPTISPFHLKETARINIGMEEVFGKLFNDLGFSELLNPRQTKTLKSVLLARLAEPSSKRRLSFILDRKFGEDVPLDRIYRMMDALYKKQDEIQLKIFEATRKASPHGIEMMFFDVTTLYFESISQDELRAFGYSKDHRFNTTQLVLALATTGEGLPIGYRLFPGNTAEVSTLLAAISYWKTVISIDKISIVADRAMMSDKNLKYLEDANIEYVVAFPLRKLSTIKQKEILEDNYYNTCLVEDELHWQKSFSLGDRRKLIVSYSHKRHKKDKKDRDRLIEKLEKKIGKKSSVKKLISNRGYLKYSDINGVAIAVINKEKIQEDEKWDGLHGVITNTNLNGKEILNQYRRLWRIEESFRISKHDLKMRPIFHYTPKRIQGHIALCFMTYALIRNAQVKLSRAGEHMSISRIQEALVDIQASLMCDTSTGLEFRVLSNLSEDAQKIYDIFNIQRDASVIAEQICSAGR